MKNNKFILIFLIFLLFLFFILLQNDYIYADQNNSLNLDSDQYYKIYKLNIEDININIYTSKFRYASLIFLMKTNHKIHVFPEKLDENIKSFINTKEFEIFFNENNIEQLMKNLNQEKKDNSTNISYLSNISNLLIEKSILFSTKFDNKLNEFNEIIEDELEKYIEDIRTGIKIIKKYIDINDVRILLNIINPDVNLNKSIYYNEFIDLCFYTKSYEFTAVLCHELVHQYQNKSGLSFQIYEEICNDSVIVDKLFYITNFMYKILNKNEDLYNPIEVFGYFWDYKFTKKIVEEYNKGNIKILFGLKEAMAYAIIPVILKELNYNGSNFNLNFEGDSFEILNYFSDFYNYIDYYSFFNKIEYVGKVKFWADFVKQYIDYFYKLQNNSF